MPADNEKDLAAQILAAAKPFADADCGDWAACAVLLAVVRAVRGVQWADLRESEDCYVLQIAAEDAGNLAAVRLRMARGGEVRGV
jgi:hypothetical protein